MTNSEAGLMRRLEAVANARFDGHLTVLDFTTNWHIGFETPSGRDGIAAMAAGITVRLWSMDDVVALLDASETAPAKRGPYKPHQPKAA